MYINRNCYYTMKQTLTSSSQLPLDHSSELDGTRLNAAFDYLENVPNIAATVCDKEGIVLYQNKRAIDRDGDVVGKNLYNCHGEKAGAMIRHMIESDESNTYQIIRHGKHKLLHQTPWYDEEGSIAGLIELAIDLPDQMPVFNRDKE